MLEALDQGSGRRRRASTGAAADAEGSPWIFARSRARGRRVAPIPSRAGNAAGRGRHRRAGATARACSSGRWSAAPPSGTPCRSSPSATWPTRSSSPRSRARSTTSASAGVRRAVAALKAPGTQVAFVGALNVSEDGGDPEEGDAADWSPRSSCRPARDVASDRRWPAPPARIRAVDPAGRAGLQGLSRHHRARPRRLRGPARRGERAGRRERRRQVDADEDPGRGRAADRRPALLDGEPVSFRTVHDAAAPRHRHRLPGAEPLPEPVGGGEHLRWPTPSTQAGGIQIDRRAPGPRRARELLARLEHDHRPRTRWWTTSGSASSRSSRSPRRSAARRQGADHGRADLGAERRRGRGAVPA